MHRCPECDADCECDCHSDSYDLAAYAGSYSLSDAASDTYPFAYGRSDANPNPNLDDWRLHLPD